MDYWTSILFLCALILAGVNAVRTGEVRMRRGRKLKKAEYPLIYWILVVAQISIAMAVLVFVVGLH